MFLLLFNLLVFLLFSFTFSYNNLFYSSYLFISPLTSSISSITTDSNGDFYFCDRISKRIKKIYRNSKNIQILAGNSIGWYPRNQLNLCNDIIIRGCTSIFVDIDGNIYYIPEEDNAVYKIINSPTQCKIELVTGLYSSFTSALTFLNNPINKFRKDFISRLDFDHISVPYRLQIDRTGVLYTIIRPFSNYKYSTDIFYYNSFNNIFYNYNLIPKTYMDQNSTFILSLNFDFFNNIYFTTRNGLFKINSNENNLNIQWIAGDLMYNNDVDQSTYIVSSGSDAKSLSFINTNIFDITFDINSNIYIHNNYRIFKFYQENLNDVYKYEVIAGNGLHPEDVNFVSQYSTTIPSDSTTVSIGNIYSMKYYNSALYLADGSHNRILKIDLLPTLPHMISICLGNGGSSISAPVISNPLNVSLKTPRAIWIDSIGLMYIGDYGYERLLLFDIGLNTVFQITGDKTNGRPVNNKLMDATSVKLAINDIVGDSNGNIYITELYGSGIYKLLKQDGKYYIEIFSTKPVINPAGYPLPGALAVESSIKNPSSIYVTTSGDIYLTLTGNNVVAKIGPDNYIYYVGTINENSYATTIDTISNSFFYRPKALLVSTIGDIYFSTRDNLIIKINSSSNVFLLSGSSNLCGFNILAEEVLEVSIYEAYFCNIDKMIFGQDESIIYVHDKGNNRLKALYTKVGYSKVITLAGKGYRMAFPYSDLDSSNAALTEFAMDSSGRFYISSFNKLYRITQTAQLNQMESFTYLNDAPIKCLLFNNQNELYFEQSNNIYKVSLDNSMTAPTKIYGSDHFGEQNPNYKSFASLTSIFQHEHMFFIAYSYLNLRSKIDLYDLNFESSSLIIGTGDFGTPTEYNEDFGASKSHIGEITSIYVYSSHIYFVDFTSRQILRSNLDSLNLEIFAGIYSSAEPNYESFPINPRNAIINPTKIVFSTVGDMYILSDNKILMVDNTGSQITIFVDVIINNYLNGNLKSLPCTTQITIYNGNLYTFSPCTSLISKIELGTGIIYSQLGYVLGGRFYNEDDKNTLSSLGTLDTSLPDEMTIAYSNSEIYIVKPNSIEKMPEYEIYPTFPPTVEPTLMPTEIPTQSPTNNPTHIPTFSPTYLPTYTPSIFPTQNPTDIPTDSPTNTPTQSPTLNPTDIPTHSPTYSPTNYPTQNPIDIPTDSPTNTPTQSPTLIPTDIPTDSPITSPTIIPSFYPSNFPTTFFPTFSISSNPSNTPTFSPTSLPTFTTSFLPTLFPTQNPTSNLTLIPSFMPSFKPTYNPTNEMSSEEYNLMLSTKIYISSFEYTIPSTLGLRLQAIVLSPIKTFSSWNNNTLVQIEANTNTSVTQFIYPNTLEPGTYSYTISCNNLKETVIVFVLSKPMPGILGASPSEGYELETNFKFLTSGWTNDVFSLPLKYSFSFNDLVVQETSLSNIYIGWLTKKVNSIKVTATNSNEISNDMVVPTSSLVNVLESENFNLTSLMSNVSSLSDLAIITLETSDSNILKTPLLESLNQFTNYSDPNSILMALNYLQILSNSSSNLDERGLEITHELIQEGVSSVLILGPLDILLNSSYISYDEGINLLVSLGSHLLDNPTIPSMVVDHLTYSFGLSLFEGNDSKILSLPIWGNNTLSVSGSTTGDYMQLIQIKQKVNESSVSFPVSVKTNGGNYSVTIPYDSEFQFSEPEIWNGVCKKKEVVSYKCSGSNHVLTQKCTFSGTFQRVCPVLQGVCSSLETEKTIKCTSVAIDGGVTCNCIQDWVDKNSDKTMLLMGQYVASDLKNIFSVSSEISLSKSSIIFSLYGVFWTIISFLLLFVLYKNFKSDKSNILLIKNRNKNKIMHSNYLKFQNNGLIKTANSFNSKNNFNFSSKVVDLNLVELVEEEAIDDSYEVNEFREEEKEKKKNNESLNMILYVSFVFYDLPLNTRIYLEMLRNHQYIRACFSLINLFNIFTLLSLNIFLIALLYDFQYPNDDESCDHYIEEVDCLKRHSFLDSSRTYCQWIPLHDTDSNEFENGSMSYRYFAVYNGDGYCAYLEPNVSFEVALYCIIFVSVVTFVASYPIDYLMSIVKLYFNNLDENQVDEMKEVHNTLLSNYPNTLYKKILEYKLMIDFQLDENFSNFKKLSNNIQSNIASFILLSILGMNIFFAYYTIIKSNIRGLQWQKDFAMSCMIQILCEMFIFETIEVLYIHLWIPSLIRNDVMNLIKRINNNNNNLVFTHLEDNDQIHKIDNKNVNNNKIGGSSDHYSSRSNSSFSLLSFDTSTSLQSHISNDSFNSINSDIDLEESSNSNDENKNEVRHASNEIEIKPYSLSSLSLSSSSSSTKKSRAIKVQSNKSLNEKISLKINSICNSFLFLLIYIPFELQRFSLRFGLPFLLSGIVFTLTLLGWIYSLVLLSTLFICIYVYYKGFKFFK